MNFLVKPIQFSFNPTLNLSRALNPRVGIQQFVTAFFFFSLLPYVSPLPIGTDVQPISGLIGLGLILTMTLKNRMILDLREIVFIFFCIFFLMYFHQSQFTIQLRKAIGPAFGFIIFYCAKRFGHLLTSELIMTVIKIYVIAALIQLIAPSVFDLTFANFLREAKYSAEGARGVTSLATEPGFLGTISMYLVVLLQNTWGDKDKTRNYYVSISMAIMLVLLSKSGTGYVLLFLYLIWNSGIIIAKYWKIIVLIGILVTLVAAGSDFKLKNKGFDDLVELLSFPSPRLLMNTSTLGNRLEPILVSILAFSENPLGRGSGSFQTEAIKIHDKYNLDSLYFIPYYRNKIRREISSDSNSTFGKYLFEYGIFYILFLVVLLKDLDYRRINMFTLFLVLTSVLFSLPIVYPPIWLVFGIFQKTNKR